jgi:hypothetical protein
MRELDALVRSYLESQTIATLLEREEPVQFEI